MLKGGRFAVGRVKEGGRGEGKEKRKRGRIYDESAPPSQFLDPPLSDVRFCYDIGSIFTVFTWA